MKNSERNKLVIDNFILHITHCSGGEDDFEEPITFTPKQLYQMAEDYIEEDHVDGKGNPEDNRDDILRAIMKRYGGFVNLGSALDEDTDTVIVNLQDDLNDEPTEEEIMEVIKSGIDPYYKQG